MKIKTFLFTLFTFAFCLTGRGQSLPYGSVIGGAQMGEFGARSFLKNNEQGVRISVIQTRGVGGGVGAGGGAGGGGGAVVTLEVPLDTDYLELIVFYLNLDPRFIRKNKFTIYRIKSTTSAPYPSKDIKREWTHYNFLKQYKAGGPFDLVQAGDILIIERKGLFNREVFDFMADARFLLSLPTFFLSFYLLYSSFK